MIDWLQVLLHGLWVVGLSILLATWSYRSWARAELGGNRENGQRYAPLFTSLGLALFALGLLATSDQLWERAGWALVLLLVLLDGVTHWRAVRAGQGERQKATSSQ